MPRVYCVVYGCLNSASSKPELSFFKLPTDCERTRSRRVQAQQEFAQGANVPPNLHTVVAADTRRDKAMPRGLTLQPVVVLEMLHGTHLARDVPSADTSQPQHLKSTIKKSADPPKVHTTRKKQDCKRVHGMFLRSRTLSELELNRLTAQNSVLKRKKPSKRKIYASDEDEPLINQKTGIKAFTAATSESNSKEIPERVSKPKTAKNFEVPRKTIRKVLKTNLVSSKQIKQNSPQKKTPAKSVPQKRIRNECTAKQPAEISVPTVKEKNLTCERNDFVNKAALDNLVTHDSVVAGDPDLIAANEPVTADYWVAPEDPVYLNRLYSLEVQIINDESDNPEDFCIQSNLPMTEEEVARVNSAIAVFTDLPDLDKGSANRSDDKSAAPATDPVDQVTNEAVPVQRDITDQAECRLSESPEPGPSGMQFRKNYSDTDQNNDNCSNSSDNQNVSSLFQLYSQKHFSRASGTFKTRGEIQTPKNCVAAASRPEQDLMNTSKEQLNLRNRILYTKMPITGNSSGQDNQVAVQENELEKEGDGTKDVEMGNEKQIVATGRRLAEAKDKQERNKQARESDILRIEQQKQKEMAQIVAEKKDCEAEIASLHQRFDNIQKAREKEFARLAQEIRIQIKAEMEAERRMIDEVDTMAKTLEKERDAKSMHPSQDTDPDEVPGTSGPSTEDGTLKEAPVYYPNTEEFKDPVAYYEKIYPEIIKFGVCKVVPPTDWKPPSEVDGHIKFDVMNQYITRLFSRWGPATRELTAIKLCLQSPNNQDTEFSRGPEVDGVEINLSKLYYTVQRLGGLEIIINKNRWAKVADEMKLRGGNYEKRLDQIYMKYLLPYDTLSHQERQEIMRRLEIAWNKKNQKLLDRAMNPLYRQKRMLGLMDSSDDEAEEDTEFALNEIEDCILKGQNVPLSRFQKIATITFENTFGQRSEAAGPPSLEQIEEHYWRLVTSGTEHACVYTAAIDTGVEGHGFTTKVEPYASNPWNPKKMKDNPRNVLRLLGPVVGVTLPTLLLGMLFSTSCWHKDPHAVVSYEYQIKGPTRIWYGIPADQADNFRRAVETLSPTSCQNKSLWLSSNVTMIPESVLREHNVKLSRVTQDEHEVILVLPNAYSCCISTGYTESESVYFAPPSWLDCLWQVFKDARESCEPTLFSMEHLLYNIACDKDPVLDILKRAQPLYDQMVHEEITNRQMLQERGLSFVRELLSAQGQEEARALDECYYCRASLFLSKVKGLPTRNSVLCLEHAMTLLDTEKYKDTNVEQLQVVVHVSVKELNKAHDNMKRRLRNN